MHPTPYKTSTCTKTGQHQALGKTSTPRDWAQVVVELEQSLKALQLAQDLLGNIGSSLLVSVQSLQEQQSKLGQQEWA